MRNWFLIDPDEDQEKRANRRYWLLFWPMTLACEAILFAVWFWR